MTEIVRGLTSAFTLAFVIASMFGLGLGLTVREVLEPLRDLRLTAKALLATLVIVPGTAFALGRILPLTQDLRIALLLLGSVSGAPLVLKAAQLARGNVRFAVSLVALQVVVTVLYVPIVLPLLLPGIAVDTVAVAIPLAVQVLLPLGFGLLMNARYEEEAEMARPLMGEIANLSLAAILVLNLWNVKMVLGVLGISTIVAILVVIAVGLGGGYLLGGPAAATRRTLGLGTAQRNYAAAFVIAGDNFGDRPNVLILLLAASLISLIVVLLVAGEFGRRAKAAAEAVREPSAARSVTRAAALDAPGR